MATNTWPRVSDEAFRAMYPASDGWLELQPGRFTMRHAGEATLEEREADRRNRAASGRSARSATEQPARREANLQTASLPAGGSGVRKAPVDSSSRDAARARIDLVELCVRAARGDEETAGLWYAHLHTLAAAARDQFIDVLTAEIERESRGGDLPVDRNGLVLARLDRVLIAASRRRDHRGRRR